jgi:two-component system sensor histidine kinase KdpD
LGELGGARGKLKVYVGMAAGVGKTYAMLEEARERAQEGDDVVIGWVEPHGRPETTALAEGLETVPPLEIDHRGVTLRDMDLDAVLRRAPGVALVDELAHTNAPGLRHEKRYADVEDLLLAGSDVISTVNVQHLESLNDRIFELTGVRVRETIPDQVLLDADELVLVDIPPEGLQARLRAGKIYPQDRVDSALLNFFTTANLSTLREVALREVAGAVDEHLHRDVQMQGAVTAPPAIADRVMVVAYPEAGAQRLARVAWRAARRIGAELDIVCPEGRLDGEGRRQRELLRGLAVDLGAHFVSLPDDGELTDRVVALVGERGITRLALARPRRHGLVARLRGDLLTSLLERLEEVDVLVVGERRRAPREEEER